jgi:hypothetical protein
MAVMTQEKVGATVEGKGLDVLVAVDGYSSRTNHAEILLSPENARALAMRLLQVADEREQLLAQGNELQRRLGIRRP